MDYTNRQLKWVILLIENLNKESEWQLRFPVPKPIYRQPRL